LLFRYSQKAFVISMLIFILSLLFIVSDIYDVFMSSSYHSIDGLYAGIIIFATSLIVMLFYSKHRKSLIFVDDDHIEHRAKNVTTRIAWSDVSSIEVVFQEVPDILAWFSWRDINLGLNHFRVVITGSCDKIEFGHSIVDIQQLIGFIKSKLGDKFDTKEIPIKYKIKQR